MIFTAPVPFAEAADHSAVKVLLPSALNSQQAQEHLQTEVLERARFSSQIVDVEILGELDRQVELLAQGKTDMATARKFLRAKAKELDYRPEAGKEGTIEDFTSNRRLNVTLTTNVQMAQGYGQYMQGQDPAVLDLYPAQEFYRAQARKVPRNWKVRWSDAASRTRTQVSGFVALKNTPIWTAISRFGTPYPPYDYYSGMRTRNVARARAMAEGLIDRDTRIEPQSRDFNRDLAVTPDIRDARLKQAITESNPRTYFDANGTLHLRPEREAANEAGDEPTAADVARAIVESYDPADPLTWDIGDDERDLFPDDVLARLALERYLQALFVADADGLQTADNAAGPHRSGRQLRCPVGTAKGGRFTRSLAACGGPSAASLRAKGERHPSIGTHGHLTDADLTPSALTPAQTAAYQAWHHSLNSVGREALVDWGAADHYENMQRAVTGAGGVKPADKVRAAQFAAVIESSPKFVGTVYRGIRADEEFIRRAETTPVLTFKRFQGASLRPGVADGFTNNGEGDHRVFMRIASKRAGMVLPTAGESEVVFQAGSRFRVKSVTEIHPGSASVASLNTLSLHDAASGIARRKTYFVDLEEVP